MATKRSSFFATQPLFPALFVVATAAEFGGTVFFAVVVGTAQGDRAEESGRLEELRHGFMFPGRELKLPSLGTRWSVLPLRMS